jgi:TonB family protein
MERRRVIYAGYRITADGASVWPRDCIKYRWTDLAVVSTGISADRQCLETKLVFTVGRSFVLRSRRGLSFGDAMGRFAEGLALICVGAPPRAEIDEFTREVARWGSREVRQQIKQSTGYIFSVEQLLARARHYRVRLEYRKALKALEKALQSQGDHPEALKLRVQLLAESNRKLAELLTASDCWAAACPRNEEARAAQLIFRLRNNDSAAAAAVIEWLKQKPDQPGLVDALAGYYFRARRYTEIEAVWRDLARETKEDQVRRVATVNADYAQRYAREVGFRNIERAKLWGRMVLMVLPLVLFIGFKGWGFYQKQHRNKAREQAQAQHEQAMERLRQEANQRMREIDRSYMESTGMILGEYVTVKKRAEAGEAAAQYTLADYYFAGKRGVPKDPVRALEYLEKSVVQNHRAAVLNLAERLDEGTDVPKDRERAVVLYAKAAELGSPRAARILGEHYQSGEVVPKDEAKAFHYFEQSAAGGHTYAMALAGWALERGQGAEKDLAKALDYYRMAAKAKNQWAQERLAELLLDPRSGVYSMTEGAEWVELGAKQGSKKLKLFAAWAAQHGSTMTSEQETQALVWTRELAEAGDEVAAYLMGLACETGWYEPFDQGEATEWHLRSAAKKYPPAMAALIYRYAFGVGIERNQAKAHELREELMGSQVNSWGMAEAGRMLAATGLQISEEEKAFEVIWRTPVRYPIREKRAGVEGSCTVRFELDEDGFVRNAVPVHASSPTFGYAAVNAVSFWRFVPAKKMNEEKKEQREITIKFTIKQENSSGKS